MIDWADEAMRESEIAQACEAEDDYESEQGIRLFFERLHSGWWLDRAGRLRPPPRPSPAPSGPKENDRG